MSGGLETVHLINGHRIAVTNAYLGSQMYAETWVGCHTCPWQEHAKWCPDDYAGIIHWYEESRRRTHTDMIIEIMKHTGYPDPDAVLTMAALGQPWKDALAMMAGHPAAPVTR